MWIDFCIFCSWRMIIYATINPDYPIITRFCKTIGKSSFYYHMGIISPLWFTYHFAVNVITLWGKQNSLYKFSAFIGKINVYAVFLIIIFKIYLSFQLPIWRTFRFSPILPKKAILTYDFIVSMFKCLSIPTHFRN